MSLLAGIHPVREALRAGLPLDRVLVAKGAAGPRLQELIELCRERGVPVRFEPRALEELKERGYWIYGLDERGDQTYDRVEFNSPTTIVLGGEGRGLHQTVARHCDALVSIPMAGGSAGGVASLNVSVAAGVVLFE